MMNKKQLQFEVWPECNNKCTYCYLGKNNGFTSKEKKLQNLKNILEIISEINTFEEYDTIGFIGGEFFQGQLEDLDVYSAFMNILKILSDKVRENKLKYVWMCATLTIGDQQHLYDLLKLFTGIEEHFWILTSYDTLGRFHTEKMLTTWQYHIKNIQQEYKKININTTIITTGDLIEKYLAETFSFKEFARIYNTSLFLKLPAVPENGYISKQEMNDKIGYFFPKRTLFMKFLNKLYQEDKELYDKFFNIKYRADTFYCERNGKEIVAARNKDNFLETYNLETEYVMKCGHLSMYKPYLDSDKCAFCDKLKIKQITMDD